jgi:hypothetical protein
MNPYRTVPESTPQGAAKEKGAPDGAPFSRTEKQTQ